MFFSVDFVDPCWYELLMNTTFLLLAQYNGRAIVPVEDVCRDFFCHLTPIKFLRKIDSGEIRLPVVRIEGSQKAARGVHISDLAEWIDARRDAARREMEAIASVSRATRERPSARV
jgi:hypothetical protein